MFARHVEHLEDVDMPRQLHNWSASLKELPRRINDFDRLRRKGGTARSLCDIPWFTFIFSSRVLYRRLLCYEEKNNC